MIPVTQEKFMAMVRDERYYTRHGQDLWLCRAKDCCDMIKKVPGRESRVLEVGPYETPLVKDCLVMDLSKTNQYCPGFRHVCHDASVIPWPFADDEFDLVIACAVWEHLGKNEDLAWKEVMRISKWALWLIPFRWTAHEDKGHNSINFPTVSKWTCGCAPYEAKTIGQAPWQVYLALYDLSPYKNQGST